MEEPKRSKCRKESTKNIPDKGVVERALLKVLLEKGGSVVKLRWWYVALSKNFSKWHGSEGAEIVHALLAQVALENGVPPAELLPRKKEPRSELLARIENIGQAETELARQAPTYQAYKDAVEEIELSVLQYASEEDQTFVYDQIDRLLWGLGLNGRFVVHR